MFTAATFGAQVLLFVAGLLQKRLLGPTAAGYWALVATFSVLFNLSRARGAGRSQPSDPRASRARGPRARPGTPQTSAAPSRSCPRSSPAPRWPPWPSSSGQAGIPELRYGLVLLGVIAPVQKLADAHETVVQATKRFSVSSVVALVEAAVAVAIQTGAVVAFGFYGMFAGQVAIVIGAFVVWNRFGLTGLSRPIFRWRLDRARLRELMRFGLPITLNGQLWALFLVIDNIIVAGFLSVRQLGYYALACSATTYIMVLPKSVGAALSPRMSERFGATNDASSIGGYSTASQQLLAFMLLPVLVAAAFFLMPVLIRHALPAFIPAIPVLRIVVAGSYFISLTTMPTKVMLAAGYRWSVAGLTLAVLAINPIANLMAVAILHGGLTGAAVAVAFSYAAAFLIMTAVAAGRPVGRTSGGAMSSKSQAPSPTRSRSVGIELLLGARRRGPDRRRGASNRQTRPRDGRPGAPSTCSSSAGSTG